VTVSITRADLLKRGARGGAALAVAGGALGPLAQAAAADPLPPVDLAYARMLVGAELLAADFYAQAIAASNTGHRLAAYLKQAYLNEQEHYLSVSGIISGTGSTPAVPGDIDFRYPKGTFRTEGAIVKAATQIEGIVLGAYLGAVGSMQTAAFKTGLAQIAACEAQHLSLFTTTNGGKAFRLSFPPALTIQQASDAMAAFAS
jgi:hypothetical protein